MNKLFILFFVSLLMCSTLFCQDQKTKEFKYTKEMLKADVIAAASKYEKLSPQEQKKTVPMTLHENGKYTLVAIGTGESSIKKDAKDNARMDCEHNLIMQFFPKNKELSKLKIIGGAVPSLKGFKSYRNEKYNLPGINFRKGTNKEAKDIYVYKYSCAASLKDIQEGVLATLMY